MKRAIALPDYSQATAPEPPPGMVQVEIDPESGALATPHCPRTQTEYFLQGTEPAAYCPLHFLPAVPPTPGVARIASVEPPAVAGPAPPTPGPPIVAQTPAGLPPAPAPAAQPEERPKKRGFFGRIFGVFKGGSDKQDVPGR